jgi:hypothetical protein
MEIVIFSPRELELIERAKNGSGQNAQVLQELIGKIDARGEAWLEPHFINRLKGAARNWKDGYESSLRAVLEALRRHGQ